MWFDTIYYHILYQHRNEAEAQNFLRKLLSYLAVEPQARFIDLACGKGRHSHFLAHLGHEVLGIDLASQSIEAARNLDPQNSKLRFEVHDLSLALNPDWGKFDHLLSLFTSFGYFESDQAHLQTLKHWRKAAKPNATLVLDFMNVRKVLNQLVLKETKEIQGLSFDLERRWENGYIVKDIHFRDGPNYHHHQERVRAYQVQDLKTLLAQAAWEVETVFGDYQLQPYQAETSDRCLILAKAKTY